MLNEKIQADIYLHKNWTDERKCLDDTDKMSEPGRRNILQTFKLTTNSTLNISNKLRYLELDIFIKLLTFSGSWDLWQTTVLMNDINYTHWHS